MGAPGGACVDSPPVSALAIVLIVLAAVALLFFLGGLVVARRRRHAPDFEAHLLAADRALEAAKAQDRGWDRAALEAAAREALAETRPGFEPSELHLVLVDDRPGVTEDRAEFLAVGPDGEARVALVRSEAGWGAERVE